MHSAKQEITETIKFLTWLKATHGRAVASCVRTDVDAWLADRPTTRHAIRTFFVWEVKNRTCTNITIGHRHRAGQHLHPNTLMEQLREIGINLQGARNASIRSLVKEVPAPLVAEMLGFSYEVAQNTQP